MYVVIASGRYTGIRFIASIRESRSKAFSLVERMKQSGQGSLDYEIVSIEQIDTTKPIRVWCVITDQQAADAATRGVTWPGSVLAAGRE